ncbi:MAG: hypothetical protein EZS28_002226 [Streblomastix strix]|uniref:Chorein N-terminal domain-containing protein n=1 Tax=Streblomastix strix TaxID=222440 RepID=A0A5J4X624_9EUKA|nr:MAG: hypothetical protein EZS28_002226 [Streblomastix strix]
MIEFIAAWFLQGILGKYCLNFNSSSLNIELSGKFEIQSLQLRPDALEEQGIKIIDGYVGKLSIKKLIPLEETEAKKEVKQAIVEVKDIKGQEQKQELTFIQKLIAKIVVNSQISIKNIHIRYEDAQNRKTPIMMGVFLSTLEVHFTGNNWNYTASAA